MKKKKNEKIKESKMYYDDLLKKIESMNNMLVNKKDDEINELTKKKKNFIEWSKKKIGI